MNSFRLMITIVRRNEGESYMDFFRDHGVETIFSSLCNGTASKRMLAYLGLEKTEKIMLQSVVVASGVKRLMRRLVEEMGIELPGNGIAMTIPVSSIGGSSSLNCLARGQETMIGEVKKVSEFPYMLLLAIAEKGTTDLVMDAARSAGAKGGTVISARGTGAEIASKFFGVSIAAEKEIVYILTRRTDKERIMQAIMDRAGFHSDAHTVVFSLPVDNMVGLHSLAAEE